MVDLELERAQGDLVMGIDEAGRGPLAGGVVANPLWLPNWILIYSLISIPIGQIIMRLVRAYQFKKHLANVGSKTEEEVA